MIEPPVEEMLPMAELFTHLYKGDGEEPCKQWFTLTNWRGEPETGRCNRWPPYHEGGALSFRNWLHK